jgi:hypothetical protein
MKYILLLLFLVSCNVCNHQCEVDKVFPTLKQPIIVVAKDCSSSFGCSVIVRDSTGRYITMGNLSGEGRLIGLSYNVGDTLK